LRGPLRILMVLDSFFPDSQGGAERVVDGWCKELVAMGHEVCVLAGRVGVPTGPDEDAGGYRVRRWTSRRRSFADGYLTAVAACSGAARKLAQEWRPDIVHCHQGLSAYSVLRAGIDAPSVCTFHSPWRDEFLEDAEAREDSLSGPLRPLYRLATKFKAAWIHHMEGDALSRSRSVAVLSRFSRERLEAAHGLKPGSVKIIRAGIDLENFSPVSSTERDNLRRRLGISGLTILSVRRLVRRMGIDLLLEAMLQICSRVPDVHLILVGKGPERKMLEEMAAELGIGSAVRFEGFVSDKVLPDYYRAADLYALPSRSLEGYGMSTLEALASGTPVIGTPAGATPEILEPLEKGLVASETSGSGISKAALPWLVFPSALAELRPRCRSYVEENYGWPEAGRVLDAFYLQVLSDENGQG
jgi:glycosyltransferase involved in cell wall biosynthesis